MRLKGIKGIVLLVAAVLLLIIPLATMVVAAGGIDPEDFDWDARYWWEAPPLTAYEREQMREIMVLVLDRYFGIDVSTMSPEEFQELGRSIEPEGETEALQLFEHYARERGFQMPAGIFEMPVQRPVPPPAEVSYWWELVDPDLHEARITHFQEMFPEVNVRNMTPEEFERRLNPPPPPLRLLTIEEMKAIPGVVAVYGRARTYSAQAEIEKWLDELRGAYCGGALVDGVLLNSIGVSHRGYISVGLNMDELTIKEAQALAPQIYVAISERAERLGIQDVPVVFHLTKVRLTTATIQSLLRQ